jgi:SOS response regulatory protein OraA/RecX
MLSSFEINVQSAYTEEGYNKLLKPMQIEYKIKIEDPRFFEVFLEGELWRTLYKPLFFRRLGDLKRCSSIEEWERRFALLEEKICKEEVLRLLSLRGRFTLEIHQKLSLKGFSPASIEKACAECQRSGYLDDKAEALAFAERQKRRGYGPHLIALKLKARGVRGALPLTDQRSSIQKLVEKRYRGKPREKVIPALKRRGFDLESILAALKEIHL